MNELELLSGEARCPKCGKIYHISCGCCDIPPVSDDKKNCEICGASVSEKDVFTIGFVETGLLTIGICQDCQSCGFEKPPEIEEGQRYYCVDYTDDLDGIKIINIKIGKAIVVEGHENTPTHLVCIDDKEMNGRDYYLRGKIFAGEYKMLRE